MIETKVTAQRWEDGREIHTAWYTDLPKCTAVAGTREEAIAELRRIRGPYISFLKARGLPVPTSEPETVNWAIDEFMGTVEEVFRRSCVVELRPDPNQAAAFHVLGNAYIVGGGECTFTHRGVPLPQRATTINLEGLLA